MAIQGFLASLELDGLDITQQVVATPLQRTKGSLNKAVMDGTGSMLVLSGIESGSLRVTGFVSADEGAALEQTWAKSGEVPFVLTIESAATTPAAWSGKVVLTSFTIEPQESGLWDFSIDGDTTGPILYTPSTP